MDNKKFIEKSIKSAKGLCNHAAELFPNKEQKAQRKLYIDGVINAADGIFIDLMKSGIISEEMFRKITATYGKAAYEAGEIN